MERGGGSSRIQIQRKSSIETEPRTLNIHQIHFAREAALFVLNNRSSEEAINIFTEGLESVNSGDMQKGGHVMLDSDDENDFDADEKILIRDVATAPF
ncbi:hypothetical protein MKW98_017113 [Papaver atlanticum]|uniref:Uncharacterized protein n=1 Tax=Papaver atlanticum TaxID=357466 RepID=A0AAD4TH78_9MAGN|nr:hypothetical protein MKW98_017113 [Papaver atlanticum]